MKFKNKLFLILFFQIFVCAFCFASSTTTDNFNITLEINSTYVAPDPGGGGTNPTPEPGIEISGTAEANITYESAEITVTVNKSASCFLEYGTSLAYGNQIIGQTAKTSHAFALSNLNALTKYYFKITCSDSSGTAIATGSFDTLAKPDTTPPQNVSGLQAQAGDGQVILNWNNPTDTDFDGVIIRRSDIFYPSDRTNGVLVYSGKNQTVTDTGLINDKTYYYSVFSFDKIPNYSSGAIVNAMPKKPEEKKEENKIIEIPPPVVTPPPPPPVESGSDAGAIGAQATTTKTLTKEQQEQVDKFDIKSIDFEQEGKNIFENDQNLVRADQPLNVQFDCANLPPFVKTAILNLSKDGKETSFILCADGKGNQMATMPPKDAGKYALTILFLDYQNQVVKKIETEIQILPASFAKMPKKLPLYQQIFYLIGSIWITWWGKLAIVSLIIFTAILIAILRQKEQIEIFAKFRRRKIEID